MATEDESEERHSDGRGEDYDSGERVIDLGGTGDRTRTRTWKLTFTTVGSGSHGIGPYESQLTESGGPKLQEQTYSLSAIGRGSDRGE